MTDLEEVERLRRRVAELEARVADDRSGEDQRIRDQAIQSSINGIALADLTGNLTFVNRSFLSQINQAFVRIKDRGELFRTICHVAIKFGRFRMAWVGLVDEAAGTVRPVTHAGHDDGYLELLSASTGDGPEAKGPAGSALREGTVVVCHDIATDPRMQPWRSEALSRGYRSSAAIPFRLEDRVIGTLNLYASGAASFIEDERAILTAIGVNMSYALDSLERERAHERSEERSRALFETMAQGVVYQAPDGRITSANPAAERILGLSLEQMQGRSSVDPRWRAMREDGSAFPGEQHPAMEALRTGKPVNGVTMGVFHPTRDEYRWILIDAVPQFLPGEARPCQVYTTFTDITERRKAEAALKTAKEYAENLIDTANSIVVGMDTGGNVTVFNRAAEEITGYSRSELQGRNWFEVVVPRERYPAVWAEFERLTAGGMPRNFENPVLTKTGEELYVVWQNSGICEAGEITGTISFGIDITERRKVEEHLRRRTEGLGILLDVSRNLAATLDVTSVLQAATEGVTRLFGLDTAAVYLVEGDTLCLGATTPPLPPAFPEGLRNAPLAAHPHMGRALSSGLPLFVPDVLTVDLTPAERAVTEKRRLRTVLFLPLVAGVKPVGALIVGSVGEPRAVSAAEIDLCRTLANLSALAVENARLHESVRQYASDLEQQIVERKRVELESLELERRLLHAQKLESLGILAGGIAHDFNNLLMAVLGNLDLALRRVSPVSPARANIEQSAQAARRATDLTRQLLAYSGKGHFVVEGMDLSELVEENTDLFRASVARTATLDIRLARSLPSIEADAGQVQQVIMNLITNASEAIGEASGVIVVATGVQECDATRLRQSRIGVVPPPGRFVYLDVSDTGCGMDEQTRQRLFDPFFTTKAQGRGLGMSAILGIVRGHGGAIFVDSALNRGTSIRVLFPAIEGPRARKDAPGRFADDAGALAPSGTVLVVDDEESVRTVCKEMVESLGLPVLTAVDGRDALDVFTRHAEAISHVILDLSMPNMDGMAALQELVRIKPGVKVILSSGYDEQESIQRVSGRGLAGFIQKPYSLRSLHDALEKAGASDP